MSLINNYQIIPYLYRHGVSHGMIKILEEQRINDEDLQTIDRDDIEHLFKNDYGFTFRDRKRFWNTIQKFRLTNEKNDVIYLEQEETPDVYDVTDDEPPNYQTTPHYIPLASSNIPSSMRVYNHPNTNIQENMLELSSSESEEEDDDNVQIATTSFPTCDRFVQHSQSKLLSNIQFQFPVELPVFSLKVMRAFEANNIESEWQTLINELASWVVSRKQIPLMKREYQAIGQTVYKLYPSIGKDGFRPWSQLCRCLTQKIRRLRKKRS